MNIIRAAWFPCFLDDFLTIERRIYISITPGPYCFCVFFSLLKLRTCPFFDLKKDLSSHVCPNYYYLLWVMYIYYLAVVWEQTLWRERFGPEARNQLTHQYLKSSFPEFQMWYNQLSAIIDSVFLDFNKVVSFWWYRTWNWKFCSSFGWSLTFILAFEIL